MFFQFPANTFLHNSFMNLLTLIAEKRVLTAGLIADMKLFDEILSHYQDRPKIQHCGFWGQLTVICKLIDPYVSKTSADNRLWQTVVMGECNEKEKIMSQSYGGSMPLLHKRRPGNHLLYLVSAMVVLVVALVVILFPMMFKRI
jgi:hypothetical protein